MFSGKMPREGFFRVSLFAILFSKERSKEGSSNKFASIANTSVTETNAPSATVPPKLDMVNTEKPKNNTSVAGLQRKKEMCSSKLS